MAGGLITGRLIARRGEAGAGTWGALLLAVGTAGRLLPWAPAVVGSSVILGIGLPWTVIAALTAVQTRTPGALRGQVAATANTLVFGPTAITIPLGAGRVTIMDYRNNARRNRGLTALGGWWLGVRGSEPDKQRAARQDDSVVAADEVT